METRMYFFNFLKTAAVAAAITVGASAYGAGYAVLEQGASNMGTAMAGATVNANNDATAAYLNPSAVAFMPMAEGRTMMNAGIAFVLPTLGLSSNDGNDYDCAKDAVVPNFFAVHKFTDELAATISVTAPFGLESRYQPDWPLAYSGIHSYLFSTDINPSVSYKITDWLSVSGGISAQYLYCNLTLAQKYGPHIDVRGKSWGIGGNIGFTIKYADEGRIGFHWRSSVQQDLEGTARLDGNAIGDINASVELPDTFTVGWYQRLPDEFHNFAVMADYAYTRWSSFDKLAITGVINSTTPENWKDTSRVSFGIHYYPEEIENLTLRLGSCFDETPISCASDRTVRIPCIDRVWFSSGFGYKYENISFDFAYVYIMCVGNSDFNNPINPTENMGHYYGHIHVLSAQVGFEF